MRISCIACGKEYQSLLIEQEKAWMEVYGNIIQHVSLSHPKLFEKLRSTTLNAQMAIATYLSIAQTVKEVETKTNPWLDSRLEKLVDSIMLAIGYEVAQDEEEEEEKEEKEEGDEETETEQSDPLETDKQEVSTE